MFSALQIGDFEGQYTAVLFALALFLILVIGRILRYSSIVRDRMFAFIIFAFFTIFFWWAFEQAGGSMTIFAADYTDRVLEGNGALTFKIFNTILTVVPMLIITWVLAMLFRQTFSKYALSNVLLGTSFVIIWAIVIWMLIREFNADVAEVKYSAIEKPELDKDGAQKVDESGEMQFIYIPITEGTKLSGSENVVTKTTSIAEPLSFNVGDKLNIITKDNDGANYGFLDIERLEEAKSRAIALDRDDGVVKATVTKVKNNEVEITASWFGILNSFFIIAFAPLFSKIWQSKYNPTGPVKFAIGLILLGFGFGILAYGSMGIPLGAKTASVSMMFLVFAYLFHTLGELCVSPVGLSYVSKLAPVKLVGLMFGVWFVANFIANLAAGITGSYMDPILEEKGLTYFFMIFTLIPVGAGIVMLILNKTLIKKMHGIR